MALDVVKTIPSSSNTTIVEMAPVRAPIPETEPSVPIEVPLPSETQAEIVPETQETLPEPSVQPVEETQAPSEAVETEPPQVEETIPETIAAETREPGNRFFPVYCQEEYPDVRYGTGTVSNNGCSITALAIVATYMTGHQYYPDELARYFGHLAENNVARLEIASDALELSWYRAKNFDQVLEALQNGKIVIQLVGPNSNFTATQHFLVMTGMTDDGRIYVIDPTGSNYERWELRHGFERGFSKTEMVAGYDGAWIFDPDAMPEDPYIYEEPEVEYVEPRYPGLVLAPEEVETLARLVWVEARGESLEGQQAVAEVVLNRLYAEDFPSRLTNVVYAEGQFATKSLPKLMEKAEPSQTQYVAIERALYGPYVLPMDVVFYARFALNPNIWGKIGGHVFCYRPN